MRTNLHMLYIYDIILITLRKHFLEIAKEIEYNLERKET